MKLSLKILGDPPLAKTAQGKPKTRIATIFPDSRTLVTLPGIHAMQRLAYVDELNKKHQNEGRPALTPDEETAQCRRAVDLIIEDHGILIRPDPDDMDLAFRADDLLQELFSKDKIKFLHVLNRKVHEAVKRRGEYWRITPLPTSAREMIAMIGGSRIGIHGREIYYYNRATGTRLLTFHEYDRLRLLDTPELRAHLIEIQEHSAAVNRHGYHEVGFFMAEESFSKADLAAYDFHGLESGPLKAAYAALKRKFCDAVPPAFRSDDLGSATWRNGMFAALIGQKDEVVPDETLLGLSSEFFMQIRWLPGGRIENHELIFDPVFEEEGGCPEEAERGGLCDATVRELIFDFVREYGDLEYVNVGRVVNSLSRGTESEGRRDVYIAQLKSRESESEIISIIRMQKYGVREHLKSGMNLLDAMIKSEDYAEYTLDRRLGCRQLGMNLSARVVARKISERYVPSGVFAPPVYIWSPYYERDYIAGIATDKMPRHRFENEAFSLQFARLLGGAAAPNMIVGRCDREMNVLFDDGDEIVVEDKNGTPLDIVIGDITGSFRDYNLPLSRSTAAYAGPVMRRRSYLPSPDAFARVYLDAFVERFSAIQEEYRKRKQAFDTLFKFRRYDEAGSFACRWQRVLRRLDDADPRELAERIRREIRL